MLSFAKRQFGNMLRLKQLAEHSRFKLIMVAAMIATYCTVRQNLIQHVSRLYFRICHSLIFVNILTDIVSITGNRRMMNRTMLVFRRIRRLAEVSIAIMSVI